MRWLMALLALPLFALAFYGTGDESEPYLEQSIPYVGIGGDAPDGTGVVVAVIDTGINFTHPDLFGWGPGQKVIGGYNFLEPSEPPMDNDGHGTQVAGIIAADGVLRGMAPQAKLLAYKVSESGEGVISDLIVAAIRMAIRDGADIINISLGVNKTNDIIDAAVGEAFDNGILVVAAAGNDGPVPQTIGSPGRNPAALTVGSTYNNSTSTQMIAMNIGGQTYVTIPMLDSIPVEGPVSGPLVLGGYGRAYELDGLDTQGAILLVERGSDRPGEQLYFSIKEANAAAAGAAAIVVFNNEKGLFYGELVHEFIEPGYVPSIPAVALSREDGRGVAARAGDTVTLSPFYNPDQPVVFSSRGPVSPLYIKPDMMAPGANINTTAISGYTLVSGTSYAAPHVSGAAALMLQQNPSLSHEDIRSILTTTVSPVTDGDGSRSPLQDAGSGRLDAGAALEAELVVYPPAVVAAVSSSSDTSMVQLRLRALDGTLGDIAVRQESGDVRITHQIYNDTLFLSVGSDTDGAQGHLILEYENAEYTIPVMVHHTGGSVETTQDNGRLHFEIFHPDGWSFAKITVIGRNGETYQTSVTPADEAYIDVYRDGLYYIQADIVTRSQGLPAYDSIYVDTVPQDRLRSQILPDMPWRQVAIAAVMAGTMATIAAVALRR